MTTATRRGPKLPLYRESYRSATSFEPKAKGRSALNRRAVSPWRLLMIGTDGATRQWRSLAQAPKVLLLNPMAWHPTLQKAPLLPVAKIAPLVRRVRMHPCLRNLRVTKLLLPPNFQLLGPNALRALAITSHFQLLLAPELWSPLL